MVGLQCTTRVVSAFSGASTSRRSLVFRPSLSRSGSLKTHALLDMFKGKQGQAKSQPQRPRFETVELEPSYNLQIALLAIAGAEAYQGWYPIAVFTGLLGALLLYQTTRVKFVFDDEALEIFIKGKESDNVVVGGRNRWPYSSFINWRLWFPAFPVLFYYKENQTKPEGQIHFFPVIFNGKQLQALAEERCPRID